MMPTHQTPSVGLTAVVLLAGVLVGSVARAESPVVVGDYSIYYSAITTETLSPEIARIYRIQRSKGNGLLNVTVVTPGPDGLRRNVPAQVEATARSGDGPAGMIPMREIRAGDGISYAGQFPIADLQVIDFEIRVKPPGAFEPTAIELQQQFFVD